MFQVAQASVHGSLPLEFVFANEKEEENPKGVYVIGGGEGVQVKYFD